MQFRDPWMESVVLGIYIAGFVYRISVDLGMYSFSGQKSPICPRAAGRRALLEARGTVIQP